MINFYFPYAMHLFDLSLYLSLFGVIRFFALFSCSLHSSRIFTRLKPCSPSQSISLQKFQGNVVKNTKQSFLIYQIVITPNKMIRIQTQKIIKDYTMKITSTLICFIVYISPKLIARLLTLKHLLPYFLQAIAVNTNSLRPSSSPFEQRQTVLDHLHITIS